MSGHAPIRAVTGLVAVLAATPLLAATFTVNSPADVVDANPGNGICETAPGNATCTLRAAIGEANALAGDDSINLPALPAPNAYLLTFAARLTIESNVTLNGGGAATTIIDGNIAVRPERGVLRISVGTVTVSGVTIRNGESEEFSQGGGGIDNRATLTLINSTISGNNTNERAGGIYNGGTLTLINSNVSDNSTARSGGGIMNTGTLTVVNSTVSGNNAEVDGGGILITGGTLAMVNSTVSGNSAGNNAGGVYISGPGQSTFVNSTISGNTALYTGAGIQIYFGTTGLFNVTITNNLGNLAEALSAGTTGAGVFMEGGSLSFQNTIIAGNLDSAGFFGQFPSECIGTLTSNGNNFLGPPACAVNGGGVTLVSGIEPKLGPLQDNGGPTQTHALLAGNPALDGGNVLGCRDQFGALLTTDQRGLPRPSGTNCDAGAFEFQVPADTDGDGVPNSADNCTLLSNVSQCDSDADGYGNRCDGDLNNNNATNAQDVTLFRQQLGQPSVGPTFNQADINCSGAVNAQDVTLFRQRLGSPPGPSGVAP